MSETILELINVTKVYPNGTVANRDINFTFKKGEIHSIVGENGAGKSTLMKMIFGIEKPSSGKIIYKGNEINFSSSMEAMRSGIGMVHQHFMLIPSFSIVDNIILGDEPVKNGIFIDRNKAVSKIQALADKYDFDLDVNAKVSTLSVAKMQKVEILKTLYHGAELMILDEPTSVLTPQETETLFKQLNYFKETGHTIIFISHKLDEVKKISDKISVIKDGVSKGSYENEQLSMEQLTNLIIGRDLQSDISKYKVDVENKEKILTVKNLTLSRHNKKVLDSISFSVSSGEILGVAGVEGNGQTDLVKCLTATQETKFDGEIKICGNDIIDKNIKYIRSSGLSYIPEDRMDVGTSKSLPISDNIISTYYEDKSLSNGLFMNDKKIDSLSGELISTFQIKAKSQRASIDSLSGGNIQKVVFAREYNTNSRFMIAEQPTHGIDIGSSEFIHNKLIEMRNNGAAILLVSADLNEVMALSDKIIVMYNGKIVAYFKDVKNLDDKTLGIYMLGVKSQSQEEIQEALYE